MSTKYVLFEDASKKLVGVCLVGCYKDGRWQLHHGDTVLLNLCKAWDSKNLGTSCVLLGTSPAGLRL